MNGKRQASAAELNAARVMLAGMGISVEQLIGTNSSAAKMPTFNEYVSRVAMAVSVGARNAYEPYWRRILGVWGSRHIDQLSPLEVKQQAECVKAGAVVRRNSRGGRSAAEHFIGALRCLYRHAAADRLMREADSPALRVESPAGWRVRGEPCQVLVSQSCSTWPQRLEMTQTSIHCCSGCTPRRPADAAER